MTDHTDFDEFAIVPVYSDSLGRKAVPENAIVTGSRLAIMERLIDSKQRRAALRLINDAEHAKRDLQALREREKSVTAREDAVTQVEDIARQLCDMVNAFEARVDAFEEELQAKADAEEQAKFSRAEYALPPGATLDEVIPPIAGDGDDDGPHGDLTANSPSRPEDEEQLEALEDDQDPGPVPLSYGGGKGPPLSYGGKGPPLSYVRGEGDEGEGDLPEELTKKVPPPTGTEPEFPGEPRPSTVRNPVGTNW